MTHHSSQQKSTEAQKGNSKASRSARIRGSNFSAWPRAMGMIPPKTEKSEKPEKLCMTISKGAETKKVIDLRVFQESLTWQLYIASSLFPCRDTKRRAAGQRQRCTTTRKALRSLPSLQVALFAVVLLQRTWMEAGETCWKQPNSCEIKEERLIIIVQELFNDLRGHFFRTRWFCLSIHRRSWPLPF